MLTKSGFSLISNTPRFLEMVYGVPHDMLCE